MSLTEFLPVYDHHEVHALRVNADAHRCFQAVKELTASDLSPLIHILFVLRALPARLTGRGRVRFAGTSPVLAQALDSGFILLSEEVDREVVLGTVGRFWELTSCLDRTPADAQAFIAFNEPGYAKAVMNFSLEENEDGASTIVSTETRIYATDQEARRRFGRYWRIVHPGSALIRRMWLKAIKKRAEQS